MPKRSKRKRTSIYPWFLVAAVVLGGLIYYVRHAVDPTVLANSRGRTAATEGTAMSESAASAQGIKPQADDDSEVAHIYTPKAVNGVTHYESHDAPTPSGSDAKVFALNGFLRQNTAVPADSVVVSVEVKGGVADVALNSDFRTSYSDDDEQTILDGIATTLGAYPGIKSFRLYKDGVLVDTLGHTDLSDPTPVIHASGARQTAASMP